MSVNFCHARGFVLLCFGIEPNLKGENYSFPLIQWSNSWDVNGSVFTHHQQWKLYSRAKNRSLNEQVYLLLQRSDFLIYVLTWTSYSCSLGWGWGRDDTVRICTNSQFIDLRCQWFDNFLFLNLHVLIFYRSRALVLKGSLSQKPCVQFIAGGKKTISCISAQINFRDSYQPYSGEQTGQVPVTASPSSWHSS